MRRRRENVLRARRGAVLAEFAIAFIPICAMFLCVCQLSRYVIARLAIQHAAEVAVRACAVIQSPMPGHSEDVDGKDEDVKTAAALVLKPSLATTPWTGFVTSSGELTYANPTCTHKGEANGGEDQVSINATYDCQIPLAKRIVCSSGPKTFTMSASFPHQGAEYHLTENGD